jgi:mercuric ion transport protein
MNHHNPENPSHGIPTPEAALTPTPRRLLPFAVLGTGVVALCCFTPVLVILLGIVGLSAAVGLLDYVLFPALGFFLLLTIYALWARRRRC